MPITAASPPPPLVIAPMRRDGPKASEASEASSSAEVLAGIGDSASASASASAPRCAATACRSKAAASIAAATIDTGASTPTTTPTASGHQQQHQQQQQQAAQEPDRGCAASAKDPAADDSASSLSSPPSSPSPSSAASSRSGSHLHLSAAASSDDGSSGSGSGSGSAALHLDTALIEQIAARAAAAAAAAVFGGQRPQTQEEEERGSFGSSGTADENDDDDYNDYNDGEELEEEEMEAVAEEAASLGDGPVSLGDGGDVHGGIDESTTAPTAAPTPTTTAPTTRAYSVQSLEVCHHNNSTSCGSGGDADDGVGGGGDGDGGGHYYQQESITSPSVTFPLPILGRTTACGRAGATGAGAGAGAGAGPTGGAGPTDGMVTCRRQSSSHGSGGKKRRRSKESPRSSAPTSAAAAAAAAGTHTVQPDASSSEAAIMNAIGAKKKALFYPIKKKRKTQPQTVAAAVPPLSAKGRACTGTAKPRAIGVVQKQSQPLKPVVVPRATPPAVPAAAAAAARSARSPKGRIEVRTVPPTIRGIDEAARVLLSSTTVNPLAYPISSTAASTLTSASTSATSASANVKGITTEGILSFPTETVYTLTTCITVKPLLRSLSTSSTSSTSASEDDPDGSGGMHNGRFPPFSVHSPSLTRLLRLKGRLPPPSVGHGAKKQKNATRNIAEDDVHSSLSTLSPPVALCTNADPALLYIHTPTQSREFVHFTKPKTFVLKPSSESSLGVNKDSTKAAGGGRLSPKSTQQNPAQVPAVTFSESREVLDRLAFSFWPGPVIIYAKCKMRKTLREKHLPSIREESSLPAEPQTSSEEDEVVYAPILPTSILHPYMNTESSDVEWSSDAPRDHTESTYYVGMRCPSHPLARRALEEVYSRNKQRQQHQSAGSGSCGGRRVRSRVVVGFNAKSATWTACPISAKEVSSQLNGDTISLCPHEEEGSTSFIDVLNGEDEQEMFMAPTCQFGKGACVSLVVDDDAKTIHIVQPTQPKSAAGKQEEGGQTSMNKKSKISSRDIARALRTSPRASVEIGNTYEDVAADAEKVASRVISVVLNRWKCVEHNC